MNKEINKELDKQVEFNIRSSEIQNDFKAIRKKLEEKKRLLEDMKVDLEKLTGKVILRVDYKYVEGEGQEELDAKDNLLIKEVDLLIKEVERIMKGLEEEVEKTKEDIDLTYIDESNTRELRYEIEKQDEGNKQEKEELEEEIGMDKKKKEMLVDILGAIGWQGFDLAIYDDGTYGYENKDRFESNPTASYIDLEYNDYWDSYLGDFKNKDGDEDYEDVYEVVDDVKKKVMIDAVDLAINGVVDF